MALSKDQRRALKLLLDTSPQGCDKSMLLAWGLKVEMLSRLVRDGLADIQPRTMRVGGAVGHGGPIDDHRRRAAGTCRHMITGAAGPP
jgi:hypothetical protein